MQSKTWLAKRTELRRVRNQAIIKDEIKVQTFYKNFNEGFTAPADYATEDWNHINPNGGRNQGPETTLRRLRDVHQTFLKGAREPSRVWTSDLRLMVWQWEL